VNLNLSKHTALCLWLDTEFELNIDCIECLLLATTYSYSNFTVLHNLQINKNTLYIFPAFCVFTRSLLGSGFDNQHPFSHSASPKPCSLLLGRLSYTRHNKDRAIPLKANLSEEGPDIPSTANITSINQKHTVFTITLTTQFTKY
jgi:hypothetical protein